MADDQLFVTFRRALVGIFRKTAETAEEATMEPGTVTVETEQPRSAGSTVPAEGGASSEGSKVTDMSAAAEAASLAVPSEEDVGSSVDDVPLIDLAASKESVDMPEAMPKKDCENTDGVNNVDQEVKNTSDKEVCDGEPKFKNNSDSGQDKVTDEAEVESNEVEKVIVRETDVANVDSEAPKVNVTDADTSIETDEEKVFINDADQNVSFENAPKENKEDRLSKLAEQIDDFNPLELFEGSKENKSEACSFSRDINDEKLIDELIQEAEVETASQDNESKEDKSDDNDNGKLTLDHEDSEMEVTEDKESDDTKDDTELSVDTNGMDEKASPNGSMTASTESEGFQDEKQNGEAAVKDNEEKVTEKKPEPQKVENASPTKSAKSKKKEDKSIEHILKALSSLQTTEEKLAALCKKYADLHEDHRVLQASFKQSQRKLTVVTREKDQLQTEHTKAMMAKSKLESLCRELQKHNQTVRQESLQRAKEEDEKRKEISQKFQTTIGEIQTQMQENHERNKQLREENFELANKLKKFIEQYETREKQVEKVIQHRELEQKLADAKLEQASAILMEEKGRSQKEKELLIIQSTEYMKKMQLKEAELKMYKERYDEFQSTIKKSEEMFGKFKTEMDKMTKRCKKVEKESAQWKAKWDNANRALLEMADEKTKYDKERPLLLTKITKLESLCRAMQAERTARKMLESEGVDLSQLSLSTDLNMPSPDTPTSRLGEPTPPPAPSPTITGTSCEGATGGGDEEEEEGSDNSNDSEETGVTVIQQPKEEESEEGSGQSDSKNPDTSQSEAPATLVSNSDQSETTTGPSSVDEIDS